MRLNKKRLISKTEQGLLQNGYLFFNDSQTGSNGLYIKQTDDNFFLSIGLVISNLYESRFTGSFYLSRSTRWGSLFGDIPKKSYQRVSQFLTKSERVLLLDDEYNRPGVVDGWWDGDNHKELKAFFETIRLCEPRFLGQSDLISDLKNSSDVREMQAVVTGVIDLIETQEKFFGQTFNFIPNGSIDGVPIEWFMAAEITLERQNGVLNNATVKLVGTDAWRVNQLRRQKQRLSI